jgi:hypothetical protein
MAFWLFVKALGRHWWALMSCAVFTGLGAVSLYFNRSNTWILWATFGTAIVMLLVGAFLAWHDERIKRIELEHRLNEIDSPRLVGRIEQRFSGWTQELQATTLLVLLSIRNSGSPTMVEGYRLTLEWAESNKAEVIPTFIPEGYRLFDNHNHTVATFNRGDGIYEKTINPIPKGGIVRGWLMYRITQFNTQEMHRMSGIHFTVTFSDVNGREWTAVDISSGESVVPLYHPGAGLPFKDISL